MVLARDNPIYGDVSLMKTLRGPAPYSTKKTRVIYRDMVGDGVRRVPGARQRSTLSPRREIASIIIFHNDKMLRSPPSQREAKRDRQRGSHGETDAGPRSTGGLPVQ